MRTEAGWCAVTRGGQAMAHNSGCRLAIRLRVLLAVCACPALRDAGNNTSNVLTSAAACGGETVPCSKPPRLQAIVTSRTVGRLPLPSSADAFIAGAGRRRLKGKPQLVRLQLWSHCRSRQAGSRYRPLPRLCARPTTLSVIVTTTKDFPGCASSRAAVQRTKPCCVHQGWSPRRRGAPADATAVDWQAGPVSYKDSTRGWQEIKFAIAISRIHNPIAHEEQSTSLLASKWVCYRGCRV